MTYRDTKVGLLMAAKTGEKAIKQHFFKQHFQIKPPLQHVRPLPTQSQVYGLPGLIDMLLEGHKGEGSGGNRQSCTEIPLVLHNIHVVG